MRYLTAALLALHLATGAPAADFGFARIRATDGQSYGAVTLRPFAAGRRTVIPLFVLVDSGAHGRPWVRARQIAQVLPRAVERLLAGDVLKANERAVFVGPAGRPIGRDDLEVVAALPGDVRRFRAEPGARRTLAAADVAAYWKLLLDDLVTVFVRFPLARDPALAGRLGLPATRSGVLLKRMLVEVGVLLRYEDLTLARATAAQIQAKTLEVLDALTPEQWSELANLGFRVPPDLDAPPGFTAPGAVPLYLEPTTK